MPGFLVGVFPSCVSLNNTSMIGLNEDPATCMASSHLGLASVIMKAQQRQLKSLVVLVIILHLQLGSSNASQESVVFCPSGTYLVEGSGGEHDYCQLCPPGSYITSPSHRQTHCRPCSLFDEKNPRVKLVINCTRHHDIIIRCSSKEFRFNPNRDDCVQCNGCWERGLYEAVPCSAHRNAICCPRQDMLVRDGECVEPDVFCGPGEYLTQDVQHGDTCRLCPDSTTNYESNHRLRSCGETCLSLPDMERLEGRFQVFSREVQCRPYECIIGKSCSSGDTLLCTSCRPVPPFSRKNNPTEMTKQYENSSLSKEFQDGLLICGTLFPSVLMILLTVLFIGCSIHRYNAILGRRYEEKTRLIDAEPEVYA